MANERNAGRKRKFEGDVKSVAFLVPVDEENNLRAHVKPFIDALAISHKAKQKEAVTGANFNCGCKIEAGLLKRAKGSTCKLSRDEH